MTDFFPCPKPARRQKKERTRIARSGPPKSKPRTAGEFARIYGSKARVGFVKRLACVYCVMLHPALAFGYDGVEPRCDNAHTENEGTSRKGHYTTIVPLCRTHHRMYDDRVGDLGIATVRAVIAAQAPRVGAAWRSHCARSSRSGSGR